MPSRVRAVDDAARRAKRQLDEVLADIREARIAGGLSQAAVGRSIGLSANTISRIERGVTPIDVVPLAMLARAVGAGPVAALVRCRTSDSRYRPGTPAGAILRSDRARLATVARGRRRRRQPRIRRCDPAGDGRRGDRSGDSTPGRPGSASSHLAQAGRQRNRGRDPPALRDRDEPTGAPGTRADPHPRLPGRAAGGPGGTGPWRASSHERHRQDVIHGAPSPSRHDPVTA